MSDDYRPGKGCTCDAMSGHECVCDNVDWTDSEVYCLRSENAALRQTITEHEDQIEFLIRETGSLRQVFAAAEDLLRYEKDGHPMWINWDAKFEALRAAVGLARKEQP